MFWRNKTHFENNYTNDFRICRRKQCFAEMEVETHFENNDF
jgi:hypothetical protein